MEEIGTLRPYTRTALYRLQGVSATNRSVGAVSLNYGSVVASTQPFDSVFVCAGLHGCAREVVLSAERQSEQRVLGSTRSALEVQAILLDSPP